MSITIDFGGDHPLTITGIALSNYQRPLSGETANLTVTVAFAEFFAGWLATPPLGSACSVSYGDETLLEGSLYGVKVTANTVELSIES